MQAARTANLRRVLAAALRTGFYQPWLEAAAIDTPEKIATLPDPVEALRFLPPLPASLYAGRKEQFRSSMFRSAERAELRHPLPGKLRVAVLTSGFRESRTVRVFPNELDGALSRYRPQALAGPLGRLEELASKIRAGSVRLPSPTHALIVLLRPDESLLDDAQRASLWEVFGAPVFQQVVGFDGRLLAWECEAHEGLHVVEEQAIFECCRGPEGEALLVSSLTDKLFPMLRLKTPWRAKLGHELCGCGQPGERLLADAEGMRAQSAPAVIPLAGRVSAGAVVF